MSNIFEQFADRPGPPIISLKRHMNERSESFSTASTIVFTPLTNKCPTSFFALSGIRLV